MRERITFVWSESQPDGAGGWIPAQEQTKTVWADVKSLSGARALDRTQIQNTLAYEITIRYQYDFTPTPEMVIQFREMDLTIHGGIDVRETEKKIKLIAHA